MLLTARPIRYLLPILLLAGCGADSRPGRTANAAVPAVHAHDFGVVPHGARRSHEFLLGDAAFWSVHEPLDVEVDCTCVGATWTWTAIGGDADHASRRGVAVTLRVDLRHEPPVDEDCRWREANLRVRNLEHPAVDEVISIPLRYRYGVDSPVSVSPSSALDLGSVSRSSSGAAWCRLRVDDGAALQLLAATSEDPRLSCQLEHGESGAELLVTMLPGPSTPPGLYAASIGVATSREGYVLYLPVRARITD